MNIKKAALAMLCAVLLFVSGIAPNAFADWYDDISSGRYIEIQGKNFIADTFYGVNAYYNEDGSIYHCGEVVERFYKEAYGLEVSIGSSGIRMDTQGYKFVTPKTPKPGDVIYVSAEMRGTTDHWALVKYCEDGYLVLFEQNVVYKGRAGVERKLKYPSNSYHIYTPVSTGEKPDPVLGGAKNEETTAQTTVPTTKATTTAKPTTTTKPTTTAKPTTTTKPTTTAKPTTTTTKHTTTTKPVTTKPVSTRATTTMITTTAQAVTSSETTQETIAPSVAGVTFMHVEVTENYLMSTVPETSVLSANNARDKSPVVIGAVCAVLAVGVAALVVAIIKKK